MKILSSALGQLTAPAGVVAVLGNHDWWDDPDAQATGRGPIIAAQELTAAGILVAGESGCAAQPPRSGVLGGWAGGPARSAGATCRGRG